MARGDVLALRRAVGFLPGARLERFVVVQSDRLAALDTLLAIPLDEAHTAYAGLPGMVPVSRTEGGTKRDLVALVTQLASVPESRFDPVPVGKLRPNTLQRIGRVLQIVLELE